MALPDILDITDPTSNLASYDELMGLYDFVPQALAEKRFMWGAELVPALVAGRLGYTRAGGSFLAAALYAFAGYMAPLPAIGILAVMGASPEPRVRRTGLQGYKRRSSRSRRRG